MNFTNDPDALMRMPKLTFEISLKTAEEQGFEKALNCFASGGLFNSDDKNASYIAYANQELEIYKWLKNNKERILQGE
jgi:hypothetical protein